MQSSVPIGLYGIQHFLSMLDSLILIPLVIVPAMDGTYTCPLLLWVFTKQVGEHHPERDFAVRGKEPKDEVQIYTWMDATLRELTDLVKEVAPEARRRDVLIMFLKIVVYVVKHLSFVD